MFPLYTPPPLLKTPENRCFKGYKMVKLTRNELRRFFGIGGLPVQTPLVARFGLGMTWAWAQFKIEYDIVIHIELLRLSPRSGLKISRGTTK